MRLLVLYQARNCEQDQPGFYAGFEQLVKEGDLESHSGIGFIGVEPSRRKEFWERAESTAIQTKADAIFFQFFHASMPDPKSAILRLKNLPTKPLLFSSLGDPFGRWTNTVPHTYRTVARLSDMNFLTGMGYLASQLAKGGAKNLVLMPHGCCQVRFSAPPTRLSGNPDFLVSFVGSRMGARNPFSHFYSTSRLRTAFVTQASKRYGKSFGLFGKGWETIPSWQGPVPYARQVEAYRRSQVVLGGTPNANYDYYTSDREFIATASGVPFVNYWVPGMERLLKNERDWWLARDIGEMFRICDRLLELPAITRERMGEETRERVLNHHTHYHRCLQMTRIVKSLLNARRSGKPAPRPDLEFLLPAEPGRNAPEAILNWKG